MPHEKRRSNSQAATPEQLARMFLREAVSAAVGDETHKRSIGLLGKIAGEKRYCDLHDALWAYFATLEPYRGRGDFQGLEELWRPRPLQLLVEPSILYGHFRAWLRKHGFDPDAMRPPRRPRRKPCA